MAPLFYFLLSFLLLLALFGGAGIGLGFLLHWLIPSIGVDLGILIGVVTLGRTIDYYARLMSMVSPVSEEELGASDSEFETIVLKPIRPRRSAKKKK